MRHRVPDFGDNKAEAKSPQRRPRSVDQRDDDPAEDQQNEHSKPKRQCAEHRVADRARVPATVRYTLNDRDISRHNLTPKVSAARSAGLEAPRPRPMASGRFPVPYRLAVGADDLLPTVLEDRDRVWRHWDVVERFCKLPAVLVGPVEEVEDLFRSLGLILLLVHQDERGAGNRPTLLARLIGQDQVKARRALPVRI